MNYWDAVKYILELPDGERFSEGPAGQLMSLDAMKALLDKLGNPERGRHTIHVTGSKGKGSTSTMIAAILHERGLKTGLFTSPHLHDYVERINFGMIPVSRFDFADGIAEIKPAIDEVNKSDLGPVSTFGALTALFFHLCKKNGIEWQVVEVGLGGAKDATNVFDKKDAAVITAISLEHTDVLGNTHEEIAQEKAGIITPGTVVVLARQKDERVREIVAKEVKKRDARLKDADKLYRLSLRSHDSNGQSFALDGPNGEHDLHLMMLGEHQLENALTAVATIEALFPKLEEDDRYAIEDGISSAEIAGRMEQLTRHPITVVDGAHNGESMNALVVGLERHFDFDNLVFIVGVNGDKNIVDIIEAIKKAEPKAVIATRSNSKKAMPPEDILAAAKAAGLQCQTTTNINDALTVARELAAPNDIVCITGSLYVVGEARQKILELPVTTS